MISWRLIKASLRIARSKGEGKILGRKRRYNFDHVSVEKEMLRHEIESLDVFVIIVISGTIIVCRPLGNRPYENIEREILPTL